MEEKPILLRARDLHGSWSLKQGLGEDYNAILGTQIPHDLTHLIQSLQKNSRMAGMKKVQEIYYPRGGFGTKP